MNRPSLYVRLFAQEGASVLDEHCDPSRCLNATRVCLDVMQHFGVGARPLSVRTTMMNRAYLEWVKANGRPPASEEWGAAGAWSASVDTTPSCSDEANNAWPGHLVAVVQKCWLVDAGASQFHRPEHEFPMPSVFVQPVSARFLKGKDASVYECSNGAQLHYRARLDDVSWRQMSGFQPHKYNAAMVRTIVARITNRLGLLKEQTR